MARALKAKLSADTGRAFESDPLVTRVTTFAGGDDTTGRTHYLRTGVIVGAVVGGALGCCCCGGPAVVLLLLLRRRRRKERQQEQQRAADGQQQQEQPERHGRSARRQCVAQPVAPGDKAALRAADELVVV